MSQASPYSVQTTGSISGAAQAARSDDSFQALLSSHSGAARPSYAVTGTVWLDTDTNRWYLYDGTTDWEIPMKAHTPAIAGTVAGTVDAVTATVTPAPTAYAELTLVLVSWTGANTGAVTLDLNNLGAKSVVKAGGTALAASDLATGRLDMLLWDNANDRFQIVGL